LISSTRNGQVRTWGKRHPGITRSKTKQNAKTAKIVVSIMNHSYQIQHFNISGMD
jgi:hypothetical protein